MSAPNVVLVVFVAAVATSVGTGTGAGTDGSDISSGCLGRFALVGAADKRTKETLEEGKYGMIE